MDYKFFLVAIGVVLIDSCSAIDVEEELSITMKEKQALDQFKVRVNHLLEEDNMKSDLYLIRWLRSKQLNVPAAEQMLKDNIKWRKDENIEGILNEDFSRFSQEYFFDDTGIDYKGRPVLAADISEWNVREAVISGQGEKLLRYMIRELESVSRKVRDLQSKGENVTQWQVILNMDNFNLIQHGCFQCLPIYLQFIQAHENYYPYGADKIISINTPAAFEVVLQLVKPVMSPAMRDSLMVFGTNKNQWKKYLLAIVPQDQLPRHFGGTKISF